MPKPLSSLAGQPPAAANAVSRNRFLGRLIALGGGLVATTAWAATGAPPEPPAIAGIPVDFILFAATLLGVAVFHHHTLRVALAGLAIVTLFKVLASPFAEGAGVSGLVAHLGHEWVLLANLFGLLLGFALLSKHFEASNVPAWLPRLLPDDWKGGFVLLVMIFVLSSFLDNIAAALIGGTIAGVVFRGKVHIGYLAAIVAASNAGGSGSVVGDTTTTMMWIDGVSPLSVLEAYIAASVAMVIFGIPASMQQQRHSPIVKEGAADVRIDGAARLHRARDPDHGDRRQRRHQRQIHGAVGPVPVHRRGGLGCAARLRAAAPTALERVAQRLQGSIFLLSLVLTASMMPVHKLPDASWQVALGLGFVSAVFDNIPLTALALKQGGYDWGFVAYAVGFGGSMIWFGSSAGVALTNQFPEGKSVFAWLRAGWHVALAYVIGFAVMLVVHPWVPDVRTTRSPVPVAMAARGGA
jgi:Na+/H+ antiporter NhaD/arsenite permease-like protein